MLLISSQTKARITFREHYQAITYQIKAETIRHTFYYQHTPWLNKEVYKTLWYGLKSTMPIWTKPQMHTFLQKCSMQRVAFQGNQVRSEAKPSYQQTQPMPSHGNQVPWKANCPHNLPFAHPRDELLATTKHAQRGWRRDWDWCLPSHQGT